jgi:hypothetical protein
MTAHSSVLYGIISEVQAIAQRNAKCLLACMLSDAPKQKLRNVAHAMREANDGILDQFGLRVAQELVEEHPAMNDLDTAIASGLKSSICINDGKPNPLLNLVTYYLEHGTTLHPLVVRAKTDTL